MTSTEKPAPTAAFARGMAVKFMLKIPGLNSVVTDHGTVDEVAEDWISVRPEYGDHVVIYGSHPQANRRSLGDVWPAHQHRPQPERARLEELHRLAEAAAEKFEGEQVDWDEIWAALPGDLSLFEETAIRNRYYLH